MSRAIHEGLRDGRNGRQETEIRKAPPNHLFIIPDGNGTEARMLAREALSGHQQSIDEVHRRLNLLQTIVEPYIVKDPLLEQFYREHLEEPLRHIEDKPLEMLIQKMVNNKVLPLLGHVRGAEITPGIARDLREEYPDIKIFTMWGLSDSNIENRPPQEVAGLMWLIDYEIKLNLAEMRETDARFRHIGNKSLLRPFLLDTIAAAEEETRHNARQTLCAAIGLGGRNSLKTLVDAARRYNVSPDEEPTTDEFIGRLLYGEDTLPPADLTIRTNGQSHLSNPGIQIIGDATEHFVIADPYPRSDITQYREAVEDFRTRERRLGGRPPLLPVIN